MAGGKRVIETVIDGDKWQTNIMTGLRTRQNSHRLIYIVGPAFGALGEGQDDKEKLALAAIAKIAEKATDPVTELFVEDLLQGLFKNGKAADLEDELAGNVKLYFKLLGWLVKENFGNFLGEGSFDGILDRLAKLSNSATSTGSSAASSSPVKPR